MSRKRKNFKKKATKQHGSDTVMLDRESGTFFAVASVHTGRTTTSYQGPKMVTQEDAVAAFNDGLYRNIIVGGVEDQEVT